MEIKFEKSIYPKEAIIKTAFAFIKEYYIHLDVDGSYYLVDIEAKNDQLNNIDKRFEEELIAQTARYCVIQRTGRLRELLVARALASTMIADEKEIDETFEEQEDLSELGKILTDWFKSNGNN